MVNIFKQKLSFTHFTGIGIFIGIALMLGLSLAFPPTKFVKVKQIEYVTVEKPVVVKVPVKLDSHDMRQIQCLAENAYFEAGNQSKKGKIAVTNVVMNRVHDPKKRFGKTPCAVVSQRSRGTCQFSWKCEGHKKIHDHVLFAETKKIAEQVYLGNYNDVTGGAKFYHANYVNPGWNLKRIKQIGAHIFYREA